MTGDARERWRKQHRRQRIRAPKVAAARKLAAGLMLAATLVFVALGLFVEWGWGTGAFLCGYVGLRLMGVHPFEYASDSFASGPYGDGGGGDSGGG
jgi:fatty acid desaturase